MATSKRHRPITLLQKLSQLSSRRISAFENPGYQEQFAFGGIRSVARLH